MYSLERRSVDRTSTAQFIPIAVSLGIVILLGIDFFIINICFSLILSVTINYASIHIHFVLPGI